MYTGVKKADDDDSMHEGTRGTGKKAAGTGQLSLSLSLSLSYPICFLLLGSQFLH